MLTRSKAASSKAAAPASLSTLPAAAHSRAHSSLSDTHAHTNTQAVQTMVDHGSNDNLNASVPPDAPASTAHSAAALSSASIRGPLTHTHAVTIVADEQSSSRTLLPPPAISLAPSPASAASSVSGRKRVAAAQPDVGSSSAAADESEAAGPSASPAAADSSSSDELSQHQPQSKKHRGGSAQVGRSQARAAVTAGVDPVHADPISSAASVSAGDGNSSFAACWTDAPPSSSASTDERKETSQEAELAGSVGLAAAAAAVSTASAPVTRRCPFNDGQILWLVDKGIDLAESALQQSEERRAPVVAQAAQLRANLEGQLQALAPLAAAAQFFPLQVPLGNLRTALQGQINALSRTLDRQVQSSSLVREQIELARAATTETAVPLQALGNLCVEMCNFVAQTLPTDSPRELRAWMQRVDSLFTQIADELPQLTLTADECRDLMFAAIDTSALQLIPALMQQTNMQPNVQQGCDRLSYFLRACCASPSRHFVSHLPPLRLFEYGADPTHIFPDQSPQSALQLARDLIRDHPPSAVEAAEATATAPAAAASSSSAPATHEPIPSVLAAWATQQSERTREAESLRRANLHAQFMHTLVPAWLSHSRAVLALLSSPAVLIPDLAVIVGRYLDLEGLPADPAEAVDEDDAQSQPDQ